MDHEHFDRAFERDNNSTRSSLFEMDYLAHEVGFQERLMAGLLNGQNGAQELDFGPTIFNQPESSLFPAEYSQYGQPGATAGNPFESLGAPGSNSANPFSDAPYEFPPTESYLQPNSPIDYQPYDPGYNQSSIYSPYEPTGSQDGSPTQTGTGSPIETTSPTQTGTGAPVDTTSPTQTGTGSPVDTTSPTETGTTGPTEGVTGTPLTPPPPSVIEQDIQTLDAAALDGNETAADALSSFISFDTNNLGQNNPEDIMDGTISLQNGDFLYSQPGASTGSTGSTLVDSLATMANNIGVTPSEMTTLQTALAAVAAEGG